MRTSVTFDWAGARRVAPRAATTSTARTVRRTTGRMLGLQTWMGGLPRLNGSLSYQIDRRCDLAGDRHGEPQAGHGELRDREVGAGHHQVMSPGSSPPAACPGLP